MSLSAASPRARRRLLLAAAAAADAALDEPFRRARARWIHALALVLAHSAQAEVEERTAFVAAHPLLNRLAPHKRSRIVYLLRKQTFPRGSGQCFRNSAREQQIGDHCTVSLHEPAADSFVSSVIYSEGSYPSCVYFLLSGSVVLSTRVHVPRDDQMGQGDVPCEAERRGGAWTLHGATAVREDQHSRPTQTIKQSQPASSEEKRPRSLQARLRDLNRKAAVPTTGRARPASEHRATPVPAAVHTRVAPMPTRILSVQLSCIEARPPSSTASTVSAAAGVEMFGEGEALGPATALRPLTASAAHGEVVCFSLRRAAFRQLVLGVTDASSSAAHSAHSPARRKQTPIHLELNELYTLKTLIWERALKAQLEFAYVSRAVTSGARPGRTRGEQAPNGIQKMRPRSAAAPAAAAFPMYSAYSEDEIARRPTSPTGRPAAGSLHHRTAAISPRRPSSANGVVSSSTSASAAAAATPSPSSLKASTLFPVHAPPVQFSSAGEWMNLRIPLSLGAKQLALDVPPQPQCPVVSPRSATHRRGATAGHVAGAQNRAASPQHTRARTLSLDFLSPKLLPSSAASSASFLAELGNAPAESLFESKNSRILVRPSSARAADRQACMERALRVDVSCNMPHREKVARALGGGGDRAVYKGKVRVGEIQQARSVRAQIRHEDAAMSASAAELSPSQTFHSAAPISAASPRPPSAAPASSHVRASSDPFFIREEDVDEEETHEASGASATPAATNATPSCRSQVLNDSAVSASSIPILGRTRGSERYSISFSGLEALRIVDDDDTHGGLNSASSSRPVSARWSSSSRPSSAATTTTTRPVSARLQQLATAPAARQMPSPVTPLVPRVSSRSAPVEVPPHTSRTLAEIARAHAGTNRRSRAIRALAARVRAQHNGTSGANASSATCQLPSAAAGLAIDSSPLLPSSSFFSVASVAPSTPILYAGAVLPAASLVSVLEPLSSRAAAEHYRMARRVRPRATRDAKQHATSLDTQRKEGVAEEKTADELLPAQT